MASDIHQQSRKLYSPGHRVPQRVIILHKLRSKYMGKHMVDFNVIATKLYQMTKKAQKCNFNKLQKVDHKNYIKFK